MPDDIEVKWDSKGIRQVLRGEPMLADMERRADQIAQAAGEGNEVRSEIGTNRARAAVVTVSGDAVRNEIRDHTLTRALDAGRE